MSSDNRIFRLNSEGDEDLRAILTLALEGTLGRKVMGYRVQQERKTSECARCHHDRLDHNSEGEKVPCLFPKKQFHDCDNFEPTLIKIPRLILYWHVPNDGTKNVIPFPAALGLDATFELVKNWLLVTPCPESGWSDEVHTKNGFEIYNEDWGHVDNDSYTFVAIEPALQLYGK